MAEVLQYSDLFYGRAGAWEPKLSHRFIVMNMAGIESYVVKTASRPAIEAEPVEIHHINTVRKIKGKSLWQDMTMTLYDPIVPSGAQMVMDWIRAGHESLTGRDGYASFYKREVGFKVLGPVGDVVEEWRLSGAYVASANFGDMDWTSSDPMSIEVTVSYDYAVLEY